MDERRYVLERIDGRLALRDLEDERIQPLSVDFLTPTLQHRIQHGLGKSQPFARALGLRALNAPFVLDTTAGLGVDAFVMAAYGCRVRALERSETIALLLEDGYRRLREGPRDLAKLTERLSFERADAREVLKELRGGKGDARFEQPEIVYLDPMYPEEGRSKSALPKKGMQIFRKVIGEDADFREVFDLAITVAMKRVVVKRPVSAPAIDKPTHQFSGKIARFDMYFTG